MSATLQAFAFIGIATVSAGVGYLLRALVINLSKAFDAGRNYKWTGRRIATLEVTQAKAGYRLTRVESKVASLKLSGYALYELQAEVAAIQERLAETDTDVKGDS